MTNACQPCMALEVNMRAFMYSVRRLTGIAGLLAAITASPAHAFAITDCDVTIPSPPRTCVAGALTDGWDGPGLGSYSFTYFIGNPFRADNGIPNGLTLADVTGAFQRAAATWASVVQVSFAPAAAFGDGEIDFYFHGIQPDHSFDGQWRPGLVSGPVFAHAWGPPDVTFPVASGISNPGNLHFDIDETWTVAATGSEFDFGAHTAVIDLESIILHELGHALGLDHEDDLGGGIGAPIMQSFHNVNGAWARTLTADDIAGIQSLYCPVGQDCRDIPEPSTLPLLALALLGSVAWRRKARASC